MEKIIKNENQTYLPDSIIQKLLINIISRKRFAYSTKDIITYLLRCLCIRKVKLKKWKGKKEDWEKVMRNHAHYEEGEDKLFDELDVITLLKSMRRVKLLT